MAHDPRWCHQHGVQVWEFRVPETGRRLTIPVTESLIALADPARLQRQVVAQARRVSPTAQYRRRLAAFQNGEGEYEWREA
jgi:hypothetical protein